MTHTIYVVVEHTRGQVSEISYILLAQAKALAEQAGCKVGALLLGHNAAGLAHDLAADTVISVDHPALAEFTWDAYLGALAPIIAADKPRLVLLGDTTIGGEVAAGLSVRLNVPLVSYCLEVNAAGGEFRYTSQICGGKILVQGDLPEGVALVAMLPGRFKAEGGKSAKPPAVETRPAPALEHLRVALKQYNEPAAGDVDITKEPVLVGIGRGLGQQDNLEMVEELASALGAAICASRPVIDQGWLPSTRLVGKSGKTIKPRFYLALGISGAPEHSEAITGSELIVAVNTDPNAPIFNQSKYGVQMDMFDLLPALTDAVKNAK